MVILWNMQKSKRFAYFSPPKENYDKGEEMQCNEPWSQSHDIHTFPLFNTSTYLPHKVKMQYLQIDKSSVF